MRAHLTRLVHVRDMLESRHQGRRQPYLELVFDIELGFDDEVRDIFVDDTPQELIRRQLHGKGGILQQAQELPKDGVST